MKPKKSIIWAFIIFVASVISWADEDKSYSPYVKEYFPTQVYWGDTHVHTNLSYDAFNFGDTYLGPDVAYRFARGETVISTTGEPVSLQRPLDFLVVTDHSEYLGVMKRLVDEDPILATTEAGKKWLGMESSAVLWDMATSMIESRDLLGENREFKQVIWDQVIDSAERFNQPGVFTAFIGYEWSSFPNGNNLHRNVVFRDGKEKAGRTIPFSALDSPQPEKLWDFLQDYEDSTGGQALAIPHNPNLSGGVLFRPLDSEGRDFTGDYAKTRARWEPLVEVTQIKGDSETHPYLSLGDEFADYERWDRANIAGSRKHEDWMYQYEYARSALKIGLKQESLLGINPFKFGMVGSTDAHTSVSTAEENNFWGKMPQHEPRPNRTTGYYYSPPEGDESSAAGQDSLQMYTKETVASGYAAVWAKENTRASIFDAMKRRETYATTGPRMVVRFFGGWGFEVQDDLRPDYAAIGYRKGVPMGGDLSGQKRGRAPTFLVVASKDPNGANLERIQIVKGWLDENGDTHEHVYDVDLSDGREADPSGGMAPPIQSTVNVKSATYTNSVGDPQLSTVWKDPDFDPDERSFYYVRVLEIPTPRWTTYDAAFYGTKLPDGVPAVQQERAYTSPIWYTP